MVTSQPGFSSHGTDLSAIFGASWFSRTDLFWGAIGAFPSGPFTPGQMGDPTRTIYASREAGSGAWAGIGSTDRANAANCIAGFQVALSGNGATANSSNRGAQIPNSQNNDWSEFHPRSATGPTAPSFESFNTSIEATVGTGLDLYRILNSTSGANPTGPIGDGTYLGSLSLNGSGAVDYIVVPEPSSAAVVFVAGALLGFGRRRKTGHVH